MTRKRHCLDETISPRRRWMISSTNTLSRCISANAVDDGLVAGIRPEHDEPHQRPPKSCRVRQPPTPKACASSRWQASSPLNCSARMSVRGSQPPSAPRRWAISARPFPAINAQRSDLGISEARVKKANTSLAAQIELVTTHIADLEGIDSLRGVDAYEHAADPDRDFLHADLAASAVELDQFPLMR